ncbi:MAG: arsenic metallochaperone ArsD family protein [Eubacteriales bacterium]|nr:arsenic metallochaperone ArsD family protein [Eubacteriales bacterium]
MKTIRVYDINLSPEMQPMDTEIGSSYRRVSTILYTLSSRGADTKYLNLHKDALTFMDSPAVQQIMRGEGMDGFPCMTADGEIVLTGRYPTNEEILEQLDTDMLALLARPGAGGCSGVCSSCHVAGCGPTAAAE